MNYPTEERSKKEGWEKPMPILTMGVDIHPDWSEDFKKLGKALGKDSKETINWVVDNWFRNGAQHAE